MTISDIITAVKEENLPREKLEEFYMALTSLSAEMHLEMATLEKLQAWFFEEHKEKFQTAVLATRAYNVTREGQRMIDLKHQLRACDKLLSSVKHRIFNQL